MTEQQGFFQAGSAIPKKLIFASPKTQTALFQGVRWVDCQQQPVCDRKTISDEAVSS
jgi:hypothetical protein